MKTYALPTQKTPTSAAIRTAYLNADKGLTAGYKAEPLLGTIWTVALPNAPRSFVVVDAFFGTCTCSQYKYEGICKHQVMVAEAITVKEGEANEEARMQAAELAVSER